MKPATWFKVVSEDTDLKRSREFEKVCYRIVLEEVDANAKESESDEEDDENEATGAN